MNLPPGFRIDYMGESEDMMESFEHVGQSLMLAVIPIYAILASQFRSFLPLVIMPSTSTTVCAPPWPRTAK